jgi:hypothetical protein
MKPEDIKVDAYYKVYRYDSSGMPVADRVHHVVWMDTTTKMVWYHEYDMAGRLLQNGNTQYCNIEDLKQYMARGYYKCQVL